jgi:hypothetical protein
MVEKIVYYQGEEIDHPFIGSLYNAIQKLSLKKGDCFEYFPFNYFDNENTNFKGEKFEFHTKLKIEDIKYTLMETWNEQVKSKVEIFLVNNII